ncbi:ATPase, partial [Bradyrhizobium sp. CCBAU 51745]
RIANQSIRVNVDTLEHLMTMVSELVLTRNQLLEISRRNEDTEFKVPLQRLSNVTAELQEGVMKTRMQPIGNAWQKLPRIVRDLSSELGKQIELEMHGADTELDRQVLDLIKDPLTHMVRNSADHGLETPAERLAAGKGEQGTIRLSAYHEGGHIIICIADNGRGLNTEKIKAKALSSGLVTEAELEKMSEAQIHKFIFAPGFSTAAAITSVSGRGVGMDVVRTNIDQIGGTIDIKSVAGEGSSVTIKIPLTLAIVSALIVEAAGDRFAIPQLSVVELVRARANSEHRIERIKDTAVL